MHPMERRRMELGITRADLGKKVKSTGEAVRLWETGQRTPTEKYYPLIAKALKLKVGQVIEMFPALVSK